MNKKYKSLRKIGWLIPVYCLIPLIAYFFERNIDFPFILRVIIYPLMAVALYLYHKKTIAEIKDNVLYIYEGVGLSEPSEINIDRISGLERKAKNFLTITYDGDKQFSIEADKTIIDQLSADLA